MCSCVVNRVQIDSLTGSCCGKKYCWRSYLLPRKPNKQSSTTDDRGRRKPSLYFEYTISHCWWLVVKLRKCSVPFQSCPTSIAIGWLNPYILTVILVTTTTGAFSPHSSYSPHAIVDQPRPTTSEKFLGPRVLSHIMSVCCASEIPKWQDKLQGRHE